MPKVNRGQGHFSNLFRSSKDFIIAKSVFLAVNDVSGMYLVQVSLLLIRQQGLGHFFRYQLLFHIG
jgi:hypothetical protein